MHRQNKIEFKESKHHLPLLHQDGTRSSPLKCNRVNNFNLVLKFNQFIKIYYIIGTILSSVFDIQPILLLLSWFIRLYVLLYYIFEFRYIPTSIVNNDTLNKRKSIQFDFPPRWCLCCCVSASSSTEDKDWIYRRLRIIKHI